jgi:hypothetical protein
MLEPSRATQVAARLRSRSLETAARLERLARANPHGSSRRRVLPVTKAIRANASELLALAALLRGRSPVRPRGVAMLRALATDGTGPVFTDRHGEELADQLRKARLATGGWALDVRGRSAAEWDRG